MDGDTQAGAPATVSVTLESFIADGKAKLAAALGAVEAQIQSEAPSLKDTLAAVKADLETGLHTILEHVAAAIPAAQKP